MKKSKAKSKIGHGGARAGAGRPGRWKHRPLKMIRVPVAFVDKILQVAEYMDLHDGQLPFSKAPVIISGHPSPSFSGQDLREFLAREEARELAEKIMVGDEWVLVSDETFRNQD